MGSRSITSSFQMTSYKIDKISLSMKNVINVLQKNNFPTDGWGFGIGIRPTQYIVKEKTYIAGLEVTLVYGDKENPEVKLEAGIGGIFKVVGEEFSGETEKRIAKVQFPAILASYLRSAVTNILASAGFGTVILPLLNMNAVAEEQLKDVEIIRLGEEVNNNAEE